MYKSKFFSRMRCSRFLLAVLLGLLSLSSQQVLANELKSSSNYSMSSSNDHLYFKIIVADLVGRDDWVTDGKVKAYSQDGQKGTCLTLFNVWTVDQSNTDYHRIYGKIEQDGALAKYVTTYSSGAQYLTNGSDPTWITIEDGGKNYPKAYIDFYWAPVMSGKTWYFYFEGKADNGDGLTYRLGSATCPSHLGRPGMNITDYQCTRKNSRQLEFSIPGKPKDNDELKNYQHHEGWYDVTFKYTLYSGQTVSQSKTFTCEAGQRTVHVVDIPSGVGNFRSLSMTVKPTDAYKNLKTGQYYYKDDQKTYNHDKVLPTVPTPNGLVAEYRQFDAKVDLKWNAYVSSGSTIYTYIQNSVPYVYRVETDEQGNHLSGQTWKKLGTLKKVQNNKTYTYSDNGSVKANTYYKYIVANVPEDWTKANANDIAASELNNPTEAFSGILSRVGYVETPVISTKQEVTIFDFMQDPDVTDMVKLRWKYTRVPGVSGNVTFEVWRSPKGANTWNKIGTTTSKANPDASTVATFEDKDLSNEKVRYDYRVQLSLSSTAEPFKSDVITAGLLKGTSIINFSATKGTHDSSVMLQWTAHHVGTDNTNYDIYRRYVGGTSDDWMLTTSVSGRSDSYTYEDKTVRPGYYYEYKIEAYSGEKASDSTPVSQPPSSIGFCQARGVVSGNVTFATGNTAVEDVRVTLSSDGEGDNAVRGYSQRVDGASEGIYWNANEEELAKVFGTDKDFTVQMFVRPDSALTEGAVIGEIPGVGQLVLGPQANNNYQLYCKKDLSHHVTSETYTGNINHFRGIYYDGTYSEDKKYGDETVYTAKHQDEILAAWEKEGFRQARAFAASWAGTSSTVLRVYWKRGSAVTGIKGNVKASYYDLGIAVPAGEYSTLTVQSCNGALTVSVNDRTSTTMNYVKTVDLAEAFETQVNDDIVTYNGMTIYFGGSLVKSLADTGWTWMGSVQNLTPDAPTEQAVDFNVVADDYEQKFSVGGAQGISGDEAFKGNFTEVRVWNHALTDKEQSSYADRVLSGRETGLALYWPMDEGLNLYAFDASYSNDVPNSRHATVGTNISSSVIIPDEEQLSRYGVTNDKGEYTIRGIPFVGSGTTYTFTPTKGIHSFSPASRNGFIGPTSLALNGYDFNDDSSFPMSGRVTYLNTDIPVDSVQFKIDGTAAQNKQGLLVSDGNGEYQISVPIGSHRIEAWKDGHRLTSFPMEEGKTHDFMKSETVNFVDSTLVNVTGRVNGGFSDKDEPLGFGLSKNRIGQATVKLSLGKQKDCSFNYVTDNHGNADYGTTDIPVASATSNIQSTAWRGALKTDNTDTYYIYIKTDPATGEFSALLPPLKYKVESITFEGDEKGDRARYNNLDFFTQNLPVLDATVNEKEMPYDKQSDDENAARYYYAAKMVRQLRLEPAFTVVQDNMKNGAFGTDTLDVTGVDRNTEKVPVVTYTADGCTYNYKYPLFVQNETYNMTISLAEQYYNVDTKETVTEIPGDASIHISNEGSISTAVIARTCELEGKEMQPGEVYAISSIEATADEKGQVHYSWIAGLPNLAGEHLRSLSISAMVDGRTHVWKPDGQNGSLDFVTLGGIITGTNFVTGGPDRVDMILRRPPGSTAYSTWAVDTIHSNYSSKATFEGSKGGGGTYVSLGPEMSTMSGTFIFGIFNQIAVKANHTVTRSNISDDAEMVKELNSYTISEAKTTPSGNTYTQRDGDTFIGRATNLLFGKGEAIGLYKQKDGSYKIDQEETVCTGETFSTTFIYPHQYVEDVLMPNWQTIIDGYLTHWDGDLASAPTVPGKMMYYTNYQKGDAAWGKANSDTEFWTREQIDQANGMPGYRVVNGLDGEARQAACDSVEWCANQIKMWKYWLAQNEEDKIDAFNAQGYFDKNYSIAGGTSVNHTTKKSNEKSKGHTVKTSVSVNNETKAGLLLNGVGAYAILQFEDSWGTTRDSLTTDEVKESFTWQISDAEPTTALSVDVFASPASWSPIFRTRGGQSSKPYEGATYTRYYQPGTPLDEATMRVEKPELRVDGSTTITDVPTGGQAKFNLQLYNASETNSVCTYALRVIDGSNPNGAQLFIDGSPLSIGNEGRSVKMKGGELINKQLIVMQSDRAIRDYENIRLVLTSTTDTTTVSAPAVLSAHFVPASGLVDIAVDHTVLNQELYQKNGGVIVTLRNLDRQDEGLAGVRVRYRKKGTDSWTLAREWYVNPEASQTLLPNTPIITTAVEFPEDGLYELQAQTFGMYGTEEVTYETEKIEVMQDTHGPKLLGMVSPEDGQLTYMNRNNMHLRFNEALNADGLSKSANFRIEGGMNNVVYGDGQYPDVAVQLNGSAIETDAIYDLSNSDCAFDLWFYRQGDGNIISLGTENNLLSLSTHDGGKLQARVGGADDVYETNETLPENKWMYMALNYKRKTAVGGDLQSPTTNTITMLYVTADMNQPKYVGKDVQANDLAGHGKLAIGGNGMTGMVSELSIWNNNVTAEELYTSRTKTRASYTPGLVGYWQMDEGHGTQITDRARSRHFHTDSESWYINNENRAAHLTGEENSPLRINIATFQPTKTDNFAYEMWFRGTEAENGNVATLMSVSGINIGFSNQKLMLTTANSDVTLSEKNYLDGNWHHLAFNVRRGTSAVAYVDGEAVKVLPEANVPGIKSNYLIVGGILQDGVGGDLQSVGGDLQSPTINRFTGDVDEIRIWSAALDGQLIAERMYERMDDSYPGLAGYFPMEEIHRTQQGNVVTEFSLGNFGESTSRLKIDTNNSSLLVGEALNAPALKPGSTKMRLDDSQFDFTASADEIYFSFPDNVLPLMDNNDFVASVNYIKDEHGNNSESVTWKFHTDFASVSWLGLGVATASVEKQWDETATLSRIIYNNTGLPQYYEISGLPTWMTVDKPTGTATDELQTVNFTVSANAPIGQHTEYVYLTDRLGIRRVLQVNVTVKGDVPDWTVNPNLYESNMTLTGQVYIDDKICEYTETMVAAFDDMDQCVGVGRPRYVPTRDAYFVDMIVYGGSATELSTGERNVTFKMYDASTGITYPIVELTMPDGKKQYDLTYTPDALIGTYDNPVEFRSTDDQLQTVTLPRGWTWMSMYVQPESTAIEDILPKKASDLQKYQYVKSKTAFASAYKGSDGKVALNGSLEEMLPGQMYKVQVSGATTLNIYGKAIDVTQQAQTIKKGYNWIGTLAGSAMSPDEAFADLQPEVGDMVKSRRAYAMFGSRGTWEGTLESIVPGEGYVYLSKAATTKTFHYPRTAPLSFPFRGRASLNESSPQKGTGKELHFVPVDDSEFPDNMIMIAVTVLDGSPVENAEVGAFIGGECRGAVTCKNGYYFLTIMGSSADDQDKTIELRVWHDGEEYIVENDKHFVSDAAYGTLDEPYVLNLNASSGIRAVNGSPVDDTDWWTLQGFKVGRRPTIPGVYIHHGKTVTIKRTK
ncbi:MAG: LamG domain-containing protein [Prevotella sp.]|nr:LamG domain-containing protein [Prevotella sp.]